MKANPFPLLTFKPLLALALFLATALAAGPACAVALPQAVAGEIESLLRSDGPPRLVLGGDILLNVDLLPGFYRARGYAPAWVGEFGLNRPARQLLERLRGAAEEGLCPEDYHLAKIDPLVALEGDSRKHGILFDPGYMARLDLLLTDAFFLYASHQIQGRVDPAEVHEGWRARPRQANLEPLLTAALEEDRLSALLDELSPSQPGFILLAEHLKRHREISARGGWPKIPDGPVLRPGSGDPRIPLLRQRLMLGGDLPVLFPLEGAGAEVYDPATEAALARFQQRHGLDADGVLGPRTMAELNVPVERRIRQIELNLERWRWLPKDLGERHLQVNIADFRLSVLEEGRPVLTMPVVVGTSYRKTPVFSARMTHLIFAPFWNVPPTILREDKLPKIKADPSFVEREHYEIVRPQEDQLAWVDPRTIEWPRVKADTFPGILRQKPGPWNPLGHVKFMFPNTFDVYLHDTPDKHLFSRDIRLFSSGCIRIERPVDLACYLLEKKGWSQEDIRRAMAQAAPRRVDLDAPLPVHILYWTAWVDEGGALQFRPDIYYRDLDLDLALLR